MDEEADAGRETPNDHETLEVFSDTVASRPAILAQSYISRTIEDSNESSTERPNNTPPAFRSYDVIHQHNRFYNHNYARLFNKEAIEFMQGVPLISIKPCLNASHINILGPEHKKRTKSRLKRSSKSNLDNSMIAGSYWTREEKEKFFTYLGRRSRHDLASVAGAIGTKSLVECEEYHDILFSCLREMKYSNHSSQLISVHEIPTALEMSDSWVEMEEDQAVSINEAEVERERISLTMAAIRRKTDTISDKNRRIMLPCKPKVGRREDATFEEEAQNTDSLINVPNLMLLAQGLYWNAPLDESKYDLYNRRPLQWFQRDYIEDLEDLIRQRLSILIRNVFSTVYRRSDRTKADIRSVAVIDVRRALFNLKFPPGTKRYWKNTSRRLKLRVVKMVKQEERAISYEEAERILWRDKWDHKYDYDLPVSRFYHPSRGRNEFELSDQDAEDEDMDDSDSHEDDSDEFEPSSYDTKSDAEEEEKREDDEEREDEREEDEDEEDEDEEDEDEEDNNDNDNDDNESELGSLTSEDEDHSMVSQYLHEKEEQYLEQLDTAISRAEEHVLLAFISTYEKPDLLDDQSVELLKWYRENRRIERQNMDAEDEKEFIEHVKEQAENLSKNLSESLADCPANRLSNNQVKEQAQEQDRVQEISHTEDFHQDYLSKDIDIPEINQLLDSFMSNFPDSGYNVI